MSKTRIDPGQILKQRILEIAREDPSVFACYAFSSPDGSAWLPTEFHREWQDLVSCNNRLVLLCPVEHAKTSQITIARTIWELGRNPNLSGAIISNTAMQAIKIGNAIRENISDNPRVREVFPHLLPGNKWNESGFSVAKRAPGLPGYSIQCLGCPGPILGARLDWCVCDDILDFDNTLTEAARKKTINWILSTVMGRMLPNSKIVLVGTSWHPDDALHIMAGRGWPHKTYRAESNGVPLWPERWSEERLMQQRIILGPLEYAKQMLNEPRDDAMSSFKASWVEKALARGTGGVILSLDEETIPEGSQVIVGVDLAVSKNPKSDLTAFVSVLVRPNRHRRILAVESGHMQTPEIIAKIKDLQIRYHDPIFYVESAGQQDLLISAAKWLTSAVIKKHHTGGGEASLAFEIEKFAVEMEQGLWTFPADPEGLVAANEDISELTKNILHWVPGTHTPDRLAALCFVRSHAPWQPYKAPKVELAGTGMRINQAYLADAPFVYISPSERAGSDNSDPVLSR